MAAGFFGSSPLCFMRINPGAASRKRQAQEKAQWRQFKPRPVDRKGESR